MHSTSPLRHRRIFTAVTFCLLVLTLTSCGRSSRDETADIDNNSPKAIATTSSIPADPFAIPAVIDRDYVQRVIDELMRIDGDIRREVVDNKMFSTTTQERIKAIYGPPLVDYALQDYSELSMKAETVFVRSPGGPLSKVNEVKAASADCVFAVGTQDETGNLKVSKGPISMAWGLRRSLDIDSFNNRTGWQLVTFVPLEAPKVNNPCAG